MRHGRLDQETEKPFIELPFANKIKSNVLKKPSLRRKLLPIKIDNLENEQQSHIASWIAKRKIFLPFLSSIHNLINQENEIDSYEKTTNSNIALFVSSAPSPRRRGKNREYFITLLKPFCCQPRYCP